MNQSHPSENPQHDQPGQRRDGVPASPVPPYLPPGQVAYPMGYSVAPKSPALSLLASFFLPGLGSMINGEVGKGVLILAGYVVSLLLMLVLIGFVTAPIFWIWGMVDGYQGAQHWNARHGIVS